MRRVTLGKWFENDDGSEREALRIDDRDVCLSQHRAIADEIIEQEPIPEPDEEAFA